MRIHTIGSYVISAALLLILFSSLRNDQSESYAFDEPFVRDAIAESVAVYGMYGINGVPKPAIHEVWWRWVGGKLMALTSTRASAVYPILSIVFSLVLLFMLIKVLTLQYPQHTIIGWIAGLLLVLSPPLVLWCINGMSGPLASLLVLLAVVIHMSSCSDGRPLPLSSAVCVGLASVIRLEFVAVWLALLVHAVLLSVVKRRNISFPGSLLNGVNGLLLVAIFLAPMINWNFRVIEVPWPRSYDAAMALDTLAGGSGGVPASFGAVLWAAIAGSFKLWGSTGYAASVITKLFACIGLLYWIARTRGGSRDNYVTIAIVLLLTPVFHALLVPFIGWSGAAPLYTALLPIWILAVVAGIAALQHALDPLLSKLIPMFASHTRHMIVLGLFAVTPVLTGLLLNIDQITVVKNTAAGTSRMLAGAIEKFKNAGVDGIAIITDQPGRLLNAWNGPVYDLTSELNSEFLYYLDGSPTEDLADIVLHVKELGSDPVGLVIWNKLYWFTEGVEPCVDINADVGLPFACIQ